MEQRQENHAPNCSSTGVVAEVLPNSAAALQQNCQPFWDTLRESNLQKAARLGEFRGLMCKSLVVIITRLQIKVDGQNLNVYIASFKHLPGAQRSRGHVLHFRQ